MIVRSTVALLMLTLSANGLLAQYNYKITEVQITDPAYGIEGKILATGTGAIEGETGPYANETRYDLVANNKILGSAIKYRNTVAAPLTGSALLDATTPGPFGMQFPVERVEFEISSGLASVHNWKTLRLPNDVSAEVTEVKKVNFNGTVRVDFGVDWQNNTGVDLDYRVEIYNWHTKQWDDIDVGLFIPKPLTGKLVPRCSGYRRVRDDTWMSDRKWMKHYHLPRGFVLCKVTVTAFGEPFGEPWENIVEISD